MVPTCNTCTTTTDIATKEKLYLGNYEIEIDKVTLQKRQLHYISAPTGLCAIIENVVDATDVVTTTTTYVTYTDHLGSLAVITDINGVVLERNSYDAWGRRRSGANWNVYEASSATHLFDRGYTMHEMLPEFGLINMNARLYDPVLGRMLSPDNYLANAGYTQDYNRYSYARNNPIKYTDPDGNSPSIAIGAAIGAIAGAYLGGTIANGTFNPGKWDWHSKRTWVGIGIGAAVGAGIGALIGAGVTASVGVKAGASYIELASVTVGKAGTLFVFGGGIAAIGGGVGYQIYAYNRNHRIHDAYDPDLEPSLPDGNYEQQLVAANTSNNYMQPANSQEEIIDNFDQPTASIITSPPIDPRDLITNNDFEVKIGDRAWTRQDRIEFKANVYPGTTITLNAFGNDDIVEVDGIIQEQNSKLSHLKTMTGEKTYRYEGLNPAVINIVVIHPGPATKFQMNINGGYYTNKIGGKDENGMDTELRFYTPATFSQNYTILHMVSLDRYLKRLR